MSFMVKMAVLCDLCALCGEKWLFSVCSVFSVVKMAVLCAHLSCLHAAIRHILFLERFFISSAEHFPIMRDPAIAGRDIGY